MRTIVAVFAKYGFQDVVEKIKLGRFVLSRLSQPDLDQYTLPERMRMAFEELGPTFVKLGQLLATRPDLVPQEFVDEFRKLQDQVSGIPFSEVELELQRQFNKIEDVFLSFDSTPIAAASIAQVHRARLLDGSEVVVKVQRPGIQNVIQDDVSTLFFIAELLVRYVPETRVYNPVGIVEEFFRALELETNFLLEANNIRRFRESFKGDPNIMIPKVYFQYTSRSVLVMEAVNGIPLSQRTALEQGGVDRARVMRIGLRAYFKMVFKDGFFHGDLHAGNLLILPDGRLGLIDFGIVGRLNRRTQDAIANMFVFLYQEDYERLAYEYVELAPYNDDIDIDEFARDLQRLLAPHFGLSTKNVDFGRLLMDTTGIAARHRLVLPAELLLFFKSIVTVEGMGRMVLPDFDLLPEAMRFSTDIVQMKYEPKRIREDMLLLARDSGALLQTLPRQLKQLIRKMNSPDFAVRFSLNELEELKQAVESSSRTLFLGLLVAGLVVAGSVALQATGQAIVLGLPLTSFILFSLAAVLSTWGLTRM